MKHEYPLQQKRESAMQRTIERGTRMLEQGEQRSVMFSRGRMGIFLLALLVCGVFYNNKWFVMGNWVLVAWTVIFISVAHYHSRLEDKLTRLRLWLKFKQTNLARLRLDWKNIPDSHITLPGDHSYAGDLGIVGGHSLLQLLNTTFSNEGQIRLISWVVGQNEQQLSLATWSSRQKLVNAFTRFSGLRDRVRLVAKLVSHIPINGDRIHVLLKDSFDIPRLQLQLVLAGTLASINVVLLLTWAIGIVPGYWILTFLGYGFLMLMTGGRLNHVFERTLNLQMELQKLAAVIGVLEKRSFSREQAVYQVTEPFRIGDGPPSLAIKQLARICSGLSIKGHPLIHIAVNLMGPWDMAWTWYLQKVCQRLRPVLPVWIEQVATIDATMTLGNFAYLNPDYVWPKQRENPSNKEMGVMTTEVGHPLLGHGKRVRNSFSLQGVGQLFLVTGSNMSGKSTFLRTIGINVCLAQAGGPVCAKSWEWSWMRIHSCLCIGDSLEEGLSYFYAEVKRLKRILLAASNQESHPVLFLIDEIFKGTNNRERLMGSEAFIRELIAGYGLGLVTTHDLELARLENELLHITNVHFQETVGEKELKFDYQIRPGPCSTTNALRIMAMEGLPVPKEST
ncbi:MAG: MutS family DNA mismatch repair protein [Nitrospirota bacterium]|nr:MutS family DNA mismatch repair protein [Nitrospirota bacterium]